jgi:hypothetical protein
LERPASLVGAFWLLEVTVQPGEKLSQARSSYYFSCFFSVFNSVSSKYGPVLQAYEGSIQKKAFQIFNLSQLPSQI